MSKRHDAVFDDVLSGLDQGRSAAEDRGATRFLKRSTALGERASGSREEKTLRWVEPERCRMWAMHNRAYDLLTEDNCRDLIDGIRAQGRQEFPAVVRRLPEGDSHEFEVVCGARRHFAVSWLRANNYPQFRYLIEVRDLTDEEAFRLSDIENRDREDISDYERACDYARAVDAFYGGKQKLMAQRLEVSEAWLSRYLQLARLPERIVAAFASIRDIRERHVRGLKPLMADVSARDRILAAADALAREQAAARAGQRASLDGPAVVARLKAAVAPPAPERAETGRPEVLAEADGVTLRRRGRRMVLEFDARIEEVHLRDALESVLFQFFRDRD